MDLHNYGPCKNSPAKNVPGISGLVIGDRSFLLFINERGSKTVLSIPV